MKKKVLLSALAVLAAPVYAESLEDRVEALEYKSYEQFFKMSGKVEYRFDSYDLEYKKAYTTFITDPSTGNPTTDTKAVGKDGASLNRLFFTMDMESHPTEKLSFFGRLAMRKYFSVAKTSGLKPTSDGFNDLVGTSGANDQTLIVERAFVNYNVTKDLTLTFGRLPTVHGAPKHLSRDEALGGNYPTLLFSGLFDGLALSYNIAEGHSAKLVYTPMSTINYAKRHETKQTAALAALYEYNSDVAFARNQSVIGGYFHFHEFDFSGAKGTLDRFVVYSETEGVAGTKLDFAFHYAYNSIENKGLIPGINLGWGTDKANDTKKGSAYGIILRYGLLDSLKVGAEYFHADKDAWIYDAMPLDAYNFYGTKGDGFKFFANYKVDQNMTLTLGHMMSNQKYVNKYFNILGDTVEVDTDYSSTFLSLVASF